MIQNTKTYTLDLRKSRSEPYGRSYDRTSRLGDRPTLSLDLKIWYGVSVTPVLHISDTSVHTTLCYILMSMICDMMCIFIHHAFTVTGIYFWGIHCIYVLVAHEDMVQFRCGGRHDQSQSFFLFLSHFPFF